MRGAAGGGSEQFTNDTSAHYKPYGWLGSLVVSVLDSVATLSVTVLGKLLIPIVPLLTKQRNW